MQLFLLHVPSSMKQSKTVSLYVLLLIITLEYSALSQPNYFLAFLARGIFRFPTFFPSIFFCIKVTSGLSLYPHLSSDLSTPLFPKYLVVHVTLFERFLRDTLFLPTTFVEFFYNTKPWKKTRFFLKDI